MTVKANISSDVTKTLTVIQMFFFLLLIGLARNVP